jgi:preprotein translocase subunit SecG
VAILSGLLNVLIVLLSIFMICLVLIQRGRGGGLAGAFGGAGGSSAFGTKAGDVFTRVTIITAGIWFLLAMMLVFINNQAPTSAALGLSGGSSRTVPVTGGQTGTPKGGIDKKASPVAAPRPGLPATGSGPTAPAPDLPPALEEPEPPAPTDKPAEPAKTP